MSEALDHVRDLKRSGFGFLAHRDAHGEIVTLQATRLRAGHIDTVLIHDEHDALAGRCRDDDHTAVLWHRAGSTAGVIAELLDLPLRPTSVARPVSVAADRRSCGSRRSAVGDEHANPSRNLIGCLSLDHPPAPCNDGRPGADVFPGPVHGDEVGAA